MKLVFTAAEVAEALQITTQDLIAQRPVLEAHGFPAPLPGLEQRWSIIDVVNWVNGSVRLSPAKSIADWPALNSRLS